MMPHVIGMTLENAMESIENCGLEIDSIEHVSVPSGSSKKFNVSSYDSTRIATCWKQDNKKLRLRVVNVPSEPSFSEFD